MLAADSLPSAAMLGLSSLVHLDTTASTMDDVHARAREGAPAGLLVLADRQVAGRGRAGSRWTSEPGAGVWMTLLERPADASAVRVLSLRIGMAVARVLEPWVDGLVGVKWPNDVYVHGSAGASSARGAAKLAGILIEARWREQVVDWVAIGVGINLRAHGERIASLRPGTLRTDVLRAVVPVVRAAVQGAGTLSARELEAWHARDISVGRQILEPFVGVVQGVTVDGGLSIVHDGASHVTHAGSIRYAEGHSPLAGDA